MGKVPEHRAMILDNMGYAALDHMVNMRDLCKEDGSYYAEIYTDYCDEISDGEIRTIFRDDHPREKFFDVLSEWECDAGCDLLGELVEKYFETVKELFPRHDEKADDEDYLNDLFYCNVSTRFDKDFSKQEICVDLILDIEDVNYDCGLSQVYPHYNCQADELDDMSQYEGAGWLWLAHQQGYTDEQVRAALVDEEYGGSKFLKSLREEFANCSSHMNCFAFFVELPMSEAFNLNEKIEQAHRADHYNGRNRTEVGYVTIEKGTSCGFYDYCMGAGSILEVALEKDVEIPIRFMHSALPDGCKGYGVREIYGMSDSFWDDGVKEIVYKEVLPNVV